MPCLVAAPLLLPGLPTLIVRPVARGNPLIVLSAGGFRSPLRVKIGNRSDRRLDRHAALSIRHNLILATIDFNDLTDRQIELTINSTYWLEPGRILRPPPVEGVALSPI